MNDNWDVYFCRVDDKPASILVNIGLAASAPDAERPVLGYVTVPLDEPDEHGLPGQEEYDRLADLEDALEEALSKTCDARYVGRLATDGRLDLFFYLPGDQDWHKAVTEAAEGFEHDDWGAGSAEDKDWSTYLDFLFPGFPELLFIQNRRACDKLLAGGDDLSLTRFINHWAEFPTAEAMRDFAGEAQELGFLIEEDGEEDGETEGGDEDAGRDASAGKEQTEQTEQAEQANRATAPARRIRLARADAPANMDEVTLQLAELARSHGGLYTGWSCAVVLRA